MGLGLLPLGSHDWLTQLVTGVPMTQSPSLPPGDDSAGSHHLLSQEPLSLR